MRPLILLVLAFVCLVAPVILFGTDKTSEGEDQNNHHLVVVRQVTASLCGSEGSVPIGTLLCDYPSATSPGYHLFLSLFDLMGAGNITMLRAISSLFGLGLLLSLWRILCRRTDQWTALALTAPLLCSPYFLSGSIWLTTDVATLFFVVLTLGSLLLTTQTTATRLRCGCFAAIAVLIRQPAIWLAGPIFLSGCFARRQGSSARLGWSGAVILPILVLVALVLLWGGLMPPAYRSLHHAGANFALPALAFSLLALFGLPWGIALGIRVKEWRWVMVGAAIALLTAVVPPTSYSRDAGRWGGPLWSVVQVMPTLMDRSVVLLLLAPIGGAVAMLFVRRASEAGGVHGAAILGFSLVCLVSALTVNTQCWERYVDLPLLALLPLLVVMGLRGGDLKQRRRLRAACVLLAFIQICLSVLMVYRPTLMVSAI